MTDTDLLTTHLGEVRAKQRSMGWRLGQAHFNVLADSRPDLAATVAGSDIDPFHDDSRISDLLAFLLANWGNPA